LDSTMITEADQQYFEWLISQIYIPNSKSYYDLFERLHETEFVWMVPNDDNRVGDGLDLRREFRNVMKGKGASVLEVLVALSQRTAFIAGGQDAPHWAWKLLKNLRLTRMFDPFTENKADRVEQILEDLIWRTYQPNGLGGFFPLKRPNEDQTKIEIWYQLNEYVMEINPL
jgi:hypothetical protein